MSSIVLILAVTVQQLPAPFETPWNRAIPSVVERPVGAALTVPPGFEVGVFAEGLGDPRRMVVAPNGDVFVAESRRGEIVVLRDADGDGVAELRQTFATDLNRPFGLAFREGHLFVGNNDAVVRFPYRSGQTRAEAAPAHVVDLPVSSDALDTDTAERLGIDVSRTRGFNHWTRNLIFGPDGRMYVSVGSATNAMPGDDPRRAAINRYEPDGTGHAVIAGGLRNPVPLAFHPESGELWTAVHERDHLGDELAPDYVTSVREGGFYGWPYAYIGPNPEPILNGARPDLIERTLVPDVLLPAHAAPMGLTFYKGAGFPAEYANSAYVALHGSINRLDLAGYSVVRIPFADGRPTGPPEDFLTGFILRDDEEKEVWGRPVDVQELPDGSLLIADDAGNRIFRVTYTGRAP
ncbi:MAG: sorbosone dehydrogenase family protein [Gemmatimonadota bacterium]|nr:sorbosone dehydrogenase family protein [Gemmatimonadota bacterium]